MFFLEYFFGLHGNLKSWQVKVKKKWQTGNFILFAKFNIKLIFEIMP